METIRNPARSRPLSRNVKRLMKMARESPENPEVRKKARDFTQREIAYCEMQAQIFMAALDKGYKISYFAQVYMNSQLAGVMDYSFSCANGMDNDDLCGLLQVPMLVKSPDSFVEVVVWLDRLIAGLHPMDNANLAIIKALSEEPGKETEEEKTDQDEETPNIYLDADMSIEALTEEYEYAYWLGYIYRCECLLHDESSRMVYGAFSEHFMRKTYQQMHLGMEMGMKKGMENGMEKVKLHECAPEICSRLDALLVGKMWVKI